MKTKHILISLFVIATNILVSCHWAKEKTKAAVNKTGEVVAKTGAEFSQGIAKGVAKTFENQVSLSEQLKSRGIHTGKIIIRGTDSTMDNIVSAYLIFDKDFANDVVIKVASEENQEYGRSRQIVKGRKGDAGYFDFVFDSRTNIDEKSKLLFDVTDR